MDHPNYTQTPNVVLDELMSRLSDSEFKVLIYICRRTFGFKKKSDRISLSQFTTGLEASDETKLDGGTGKSKQSVLTALKKLVEFDLVMRTKKGLGYSYQLNLECDIKEVVQKLDMSKNLTTTSLKIRPKVVQKLDTQKKEKERERKNMRNQLPQTLQEFVFECRKSNQRHIQIIGEYADEIKPDFKTRGQWSTFLKRNLRPGRDLSEYSDDQIAKAMKNISQANYLTRWTLETVSKYL